MQRHHLPPAAFLLACSLAVAACGGDDATTAPVTSVRPTTAVTPATTAPATTAPDTTAPATSPATTAPATSAPATTAPAARPMDEQGASAIRELLAVHDDGTQFVGAVVAASDASGAIDVATLGHPSIGSPEPVDPEVAWNIGSVTKTFVAVVVLQLADEGRIDLDAGIDRWFPDLPDAATITTRDLLRHTSGLAEYIDLAAADPARVWTPDELVALAESRGRVGAPGGAHSYANTNYLVLGEIVERVTGHAWSDEVEARISGPLGMTHTGVITGREGSGPAHSFTDGAWVDVTGRTDPSIGGAAGAMASTATDLLRFARALASGTLLPPDLQREMETFVPGEDYSAFGVDHGYGLGIERYAAGDVVALGHMGVGAGQSAFIGYDRAHGTAVAVQFNADVPGVQAMLGIEVLTALAA